MNTRRLLPLTILAALSCSNPNQDAAVVQQANTIDVAAARTAIAAVNAKWDADLVKGDAAAIAANFTEDAARHYPGRATLSGRPAIEADMRTDFTNTKYSASSTVTDEIIPAGDMVIEIGTWAGTGVTKGKSRKTGGRYFAVWKRDASSSWKIIRDIFNEAELK